MTLVPRLAREVRTSREKVSDDSARPFEEYRAAAAWVLLGEPGAGKTEVLKQEASVAGGTYLRVAEFIHSEQYGEWRGATLFLDGLDEVRAGEGRDVLEEIRSRLRALGNPRFRLACRAADWYGSTDASDLGEVSADRSLRVLLLQPLSDTEILQILRDNFAVAEPDRFVEEARRRGVDNLLDNPQTLGMLAEAVGDHWPGSRKETFELACEKLAQEQNVRHRNRTRTSPFSAQKLLAAAGQLCAVLLLSNRTGVALDSACADDLFPAIDELGPPQRDSAVAALGTRLFRPESEDRFTPAHRSVAEFLAARQLAASVGQGGLPLGRLLNAMVAPDGRAVAGLRGLYAWFAVHCLRSEDRARLIEADPLAVILYGDATPLPLSDKRALLAGLRREAQLDTAFCSRAASHSFGALADGGLEAELRAILEAPERDEKSQAMAECVLVTLAHGQALPSLAATIKSIIADQTRSTVVRERALEAWLSFAPSPDEAVQLLASVANGVIADPDDELAGVLLEFLYPGHLGPEALISYLHPPKDPDLLGTFLWFWHELPRRAPDFDLAPLLDALAARTDGPFRALLAHHTFFPMVGALLARGVAVEGDRVSAERLFGWLGIGADEFEWAERAPADRARIRAWLEQRPERYRELLALCFAQWCHVDEAAGSPDACRRRLHGAGAPAALAQWHLEQAAAAASERLAEAHLQAAGEIPGRGGLPQVAIDVWRSAHPEMAHLLDRPYRVAEQAADYATPAASRRKQQQAEREERTRKLLERLDEIRAGTAPLQLLHALAAVWFGIHPSARGSSPPERFDSFSGQGPELLSATEAGLIGCPERADLPTVDDIIKGAAARREHFVRLPCLAGMALRWRNSPASALTLPTGVLRRMVAFQLTAPGAGVPEWLKALMAVQPDLVAELVVASTSAALKSKLEYVGPIASLERDPAFRPVAERAVPELLAKFPTRARAGQLAYLKQLLKTALRYRLDALPFLVERKSASKGMDAAQKVYWLAAGTLFDPVRFEQQFWTYVGDSAVRIAHVSTFLGERFGELLPEAGLGAPLLGRLIELLTPDAELGWQDGWASEAMRRGDQVRALISRLVRLGTTEAEGEIDRLLALPALKKIRSRLEGAQHELRLRRREQAFRFLSLAEVVQVLENRAPANPSDLVVLILEHLDEIAKEIEGGNGDLYDQFWARADERKPENKCRDVLRGLLRPRLEPFGIDCQPERDSRGDRRVDIGVSRGVRMAVPMELKCEDNDELWTGLRSQLVDQYAKAPEAAGYGVYVVLWFGMGGQPLPKDGGKKPRSPEELQTRLTALLDPEEQRRIFVRVIDVSRPPSAKKDGKR